MNAVIVRYRVKPDAGEVNEEKVKAVFAELESDDPGGVRYATFRAEDGVSFTHVAIVDGEQNPLPETAAFKEFQRELADRCDEPPNAVQQSLVGSYRFFG